MYNDAHIYDLSFVSPTRRPPAKPQLMFTIDERYLEETLRRLTMIAGRTMEGNYLDSRSECVLPFRDLFSTPGFGYGSCGFVVRSSESVSFCIELSNAKLYEAALTINLLTSAFLVPFEEGKKRSNRTQQIDLETCCIRNRHSGYGHAIGGYVSSEVLEWLCKQAEGLMDDRHYAPVPKEVHTAMRQAFAAVVPESHKRWTSECDGRITKDGRFMLACSGNACDVAIYPESYHPKDGIGARFSCHNLDHAHQQIALLAGLAKLCELARKEA